MYSILLYFLLWDSFWQYNCYNFMLVFLSTLLLLYCWFFSFFWYYVILRNLGEKGVCLSMPERWVSRFRTKRLCFTLLWSNENFYFSKSLNDCLRSLYYDCKIVCYRWLIFFAQKLRLRDCQSDSREERSSGHYFIYQLTYGLCITATYIDTV